MCWCRPDVRTPCCGEERCHEAARRRWKEDELRGIEVVRRRGLPPDEDCRWCARKVAAHAPPPVPRTCPTCHGKGTVLVQQGVAPGTADGELRYDGHPTQPPR